MRQRGGRWSVALFLTAGGLSVATVVVVCIRSRWPDLEVIGHWLSRQWLVIALPVAAVGFGTSGIVLRRRAAAAGQGAPSPRWVRRTEEGGPERRSTDSQSVALVPADRSLTGDKGWDWSKLTSVATAFAALAALVFTGLSLNATRDQNALASIHRRIGSGGRVEMRKVPSELG